MNTDRIIGLAPRTSYDFTVQTINMQVGFVYAGAPTTIDVNTTAPQSKF